MPCLVDDREGPKEIVHLVTAIQRRDLTPLEMAVCVHNTLRAKKVRAKQLAATLGKSEAWVSKYKSIATWWNGLDQGDRAEAKLWAEAQTETNADKLYARATAERQAPVPPTPTAAPAAEAEQLDLVGDDRTGEAEGESALRELVSWVDQHAAALKRAGIDVAECYRSDKDAVQLRVSVKDKGAARLLAALKTFVG